MAGENNIERELQRLSYEVAEIKRQAAEVVGLAKLGKRLGLDGRAQAVLCATFVVDRQLDRLAKTVGCDLRHNGYVKRTLEAEDEYIANLVELAITSYDGELTEVTSMAVEKKTKSESGQVESGGKPETKVEVTREEKVETERGFVPEVEDVDKGQNPIDFGDDEESETIAIGAGGFGAGADLSALRGFLG